MAEYVSKSTLYALCGQRGITSLHVSDIDNMLTADVVPVVHGKWQYVETDDEHFFLCSICNNKEYWESNYCPECGAKMDLDY